MAGYKVSGRVPQVVALLSGKVVHLYAGDVVPAGVAEKSIDHLLSLGFIESDGEDEGESGQPKGNASREDWAAYAESIGIAVPEDAKQKDIRDLVAAAAK